jgi:hypothetical protein
LTGLTGLTGEIGTMRPDNRPVSSKDATSGNGHHAGFFAHISPENLFRKSFSKMLLTLLSATRIR